jgi:hypothetical protein
MNIKRFHASSGSFSLASVLGNFHIPCLFFYLPASLALAAACDACQHATFALGLGVPIDAVALEPMIVSGRARMTSTKKTELEMLRLENNCAEQANQRAETPSIQDLALSTFDSFSARRTVCGGESK